MSAIRIGGADRTRQEPRCASSGRSRRMRRRTGWDDGEAARYFNLLQLGPALCLVGGVEFVRHVFVKIHTGLGARDDARVCRTVYTPVCRNTSVQTGPGRCACNNCSTGAHLTAFPSLRRATFPKPVSTTHTHSLQHTNARSRRPFYFRPVSVTRLSPQHVHGCVHSFSAVLTRRPTAPAATDPQRRGASPLADSSGSHPPKAPVPASGSNRGPPGRPSEVVRCGDLALRTTWNDRPRGRARSAHTTRSKRRSTGRRTPTRSLPQSPSSPPTGSRAAPEGACSRPAI